MTLVGKHIVITRAAHQYAELSDLLLQEQAHPVAYPAIEIAPPQDISILDSALTTALLGEFDWIVFTSANAVQAVAARLQALRLPLHSTIQIAAVGAATAQAVTDCLSTRAQIIPSHYSADHLQKALPITSGTHVLLPQSAIAPTDFADSLRARGAEVVIAPAYTIIPGQGGVHLPSWVAQGRINALTFTSGSTVNEFCVRYAHDGGTVSDLAALPIACFSGSAEKALQTSCLSLAARAHTHSLAALVAALKDYFYAQ